MQYDDRYTPFLQIAGLDTVSFLVRRGLPVINTAAITALVDRYCPKINLVAYLLIYLISSLSCNLAFVYNIGGARRRTAFTWLSER